ncbi:galectin-7-like isoform X2 [Onthophagus taurus]|nr:galectin-9-like isoform X2 [Onthophagus taurus]
MAQPLVNPGVPLTAPFDGPLFPGKMVRIRGYTPPNGERFDINFQTKPTAYDTDDIAYHISFRMMQGYVARNSFQNGDWQMEEGDGDLPIQNGVPFELLILIEDMQFKLAINGRHYCDFRHRIPFQAITHLGIEGDITLSLVAFEGNPPAYGSQPNYNGQPEMYAPGQPYGQPGMPSAPPPYSP